MLTLTSKQQLNLSLTRLIICKQALHVRALLQTSCAAQLQCTNFTSKVFFNSYRTVWHKSPTKVKRINSIRYTFESFSTLPQIKLSKFTREQYSYGSVVWDSLDIKLGTNFSLRVKTTPKTQAFQLLGSGSKGRAVKQALPIFEFLNTYLCSAFNYSKKFRALNLIQTCLLKHLRRYLLILGVLTANLFVVGLISNFNFYWKLLNSAQQEIYLHPISGEIVYDIGLTPAKLSLISSESQKTYLANIFEDLQIDNSLNPSSMESLEWLLASGELDLRAWSHSTLGKEQRWQRYILTWENLLFLPKYNHGSVKAKKARSIKRRRTKILVTSTKYRFWPN